MSKLIQLRQRIKVIETIKKITHAMRLISMSVHSHLKRDEIPLTHYVHQLETIFAQLQLHVPDWQHPIMHPEKTGEQRHLIILIGSQKGLCGSFNANLFKLCERYLHETALFENPSTFIAVGQKAIDFLKDQKISSIKYSYGKFSPQRISSIAHEIAHTILHAKPAYNSVTVLSNEFKSFFNQKPRSYSLIPFAGQPSSTITTSDDILWEQSPDTLLSTLVAQYLESHLHLLLFESLLAEHAARFISMDTATRNAESLLDEARLQYNKLRQAKITKELTELSSSY